MGVSAAFGRVRYWAGQKLLRSPFHPLYLKVTGQEPLPQTYEEWLRAETHGPSGVPLPDHYELVTQAGVTLSADAIHWLVREAEHNGATRVYADEDQLDPVTNQRHSPVFRPHWSPELFAHCDYIGGCYLQRRGSTETTWSHVPRVLFHRTSAVHYQAAAPTATTPTPSRTTAIICSRDPKLLNTCLQSLRNVQGLEAVPVLHLGQGAEDADLKSVAETHNCTPLEYREPFNFARMCNLAAASPQCHGDYLLFLNDDVTPISDGWLNRMLSQAQQPGTGAVGALLYFPDGRIQHAGVMIGTPNGAGHPGRLSNGSSIWPWLTMTREVSAVTAACLLMPRSVFHAIGGFDEGFPVNYNDVDLCLRIRQAGHRIILEAGARLEHAESTTREPGIRYSERRKFLERWSAQLEKGDPYFNPNLTDDELLLPDPGAFARIEVR
jgi:GT2 family glycosyltransferase